MSKGKVLVCDDSDMMVKMTKFALEAEGFEVDAANHTGEIFSKISEGKPDLILLDLNLPDAGGKTVLEELKRQEDTRHIPVVLFSGEEKLGHIAEQLKADGFIGKPFDVPGMIDTIQKLMPETRTS
jgi:CheY-like chemotaxis protein